MAPSPEPFQVSISETALADLIAAKRDAPPRPPADRIDLEVRGHLVRARFCRARGPPGKGGPLRR